MAKSLAKKPGEKKAASSKKAMPKWEKPTEELIEKFYASLPADSRVERRKMFGLPCAFVNGNMAVGMFAQLIMVRLNEKEREEWIKKGAKQFEPMPGRPMKEYIELPVGTVNNPEALKEVVQQSFNYVLKLKPKEKKKK